MGKGEAAKISQRLIQIAKPYLTAGDSLDECEKELSLASTAWNLSLFPADSREEQMRKSLQCLAALDPEDRQLITEHIRDLVRRKEQFFPEDRRMIAKVDVLLEGGSLRVLVMSEI
jgi:hypothetical protein